MPKKFVFSRQRCVWVDGFIRCVTVPYLSNQGLNFFTAKIKLSFEVIRLEDLSTQKVKDRHRIFENGKPHRVNLWKTASQVTGQIDSREPDHPWKTFWRSNLFATGVAAC